MIATFHLEHKDEVQIDRIPSDGFVQQVTDHRARVRYFEEVVEEMVESPLFYDFKKVYDFGSGNSSRST